MEIEQGGVEPGQAAHLLGRGADEQVDDLLCRDALVLGHVVAAQLPLGRPALAQVVGHGAPLLVDLDPGVDDVAAGKLFVVVMVEAVGIHDLKAETIRPGAAPFVQADEALAVAGNDPQDQPVQVGQGLAAVEIAHAGTGPALPGRLDGGVGRLVGL